MKRFTPPYFSSIALSFTMLFALALQSNAIAATNYVTFNDGRVYVFPDSCIASMTTGDDGISFTALDGKVYSYSNSQIASISQTLSKEQPTIASFKFSNKNNHQVVTDASGSITDNEITAQVIGIGKRLTATFELSDAEARLYDRDIELESKVSRLRYDTTRVLVAGYPGDMVLSLQDAGTYAFKPYGREYAVNVTFLTDLATAVPRIDINTVGGVNISSKEYYLDAQIIIDGKGVFPSMTDSVKVKGRGNTSWSTDPNSKNPYRLKFNSKVKPLGLTKGKNWVLLANKISGSMLTNAIGMKASSLIGTTAANHIIPVDLYVNGKYKGSYNFTEKVGLAGNSVDIDNDVAAALLELDTHYDEPVGQKFKSAIYNLPVNVKEPEFGADSTLLTLNDISQRFNSFVSTVNAGGSLEEQVDIDQLARYLLANELVCNKELFHPKSVFCYYENVLDEASKLVFGPVWDLDWACGYNGVSGTTYFKNNIRADYYGATASMTQNAFFSALHNDAKVGRRLYEVCRDFIKNGLDELCEYCLDYYQYARPSLEKNGTAAVDATDYAAQSAQAAIWVRQRTEFIFDKLKQEQIIPGDLDDDGILSVADLAMLIDLLLSGDSSTSDGMNPDIDNDGIASVSDVAVLIDVLLETSHQP